MKVLFYGSRGWIGKQFVEYLNDNNVKYIEADARADDENAVENEVIRYSPTHIISFIGRTYGGKYNTIDYLEQPGKLVDNIRDNLYAPMVLSIIAKNIIFILPIWARDVFLILLIQMIHTLMMTLNQIFWIFLLNC